MLFFQLILHVDVVQCNCPNSRIWFYIYKDIYIYIYHITLTFFSVLSPSHFLAPWQSCVLSTVVLINEYEWMNKTVVNAAVDFARLPRRGPRVRCRGGGRWWCWIEGCVRSGKSRLQDGLHHQTVPYSVTYCCSAGSPAMTLSTTVSHCIAASD